MFEYIDFKLQDKEHDIKFHKLSEALITNIFDGIVRLEKDFLDKKINIENTISEINE